MTKCPKCGFEIDAKAIEILGENFKGVPSEQVVNYVNQVLLSLIGTIQYIKSQPPIKYPSLFKQFLAEWNTNGEHIIKAILYATKPEHREAIAALIQAIFT
jgi:hypothetical protein